MGNKPNKSEIQLENFLARKQETYTTLSLRPQGDYTTLNENAINICMVSNNGREYLFGGISEGFYDKMVNIYDWREDKVREKHKIKS